MDKASDFGSEDCRFESCHGRCYYFFFPGPSCRGGEVLAAVPATAEGQNISSWSHREGGGGGGRGKVIFRSKSAGFFAFISLLNPTLTLYVRRKEAEAVRARRESHRRKEEAK